MISSLMFLLNTSNNVIIYDETENDELMTYDTYLPTVFLMAKLNDSKETFMHHFVWVNY